MNCTERVHWVLIRVTTKLGGDLVDSIKWDGLPWSVRCKWDWYFKYRSALLQIKYPRYEIQMSWGNEPAVGKSLIQILKEKVSSKKGQLTKFKSLLHQARVNWNQIFPIENEPDYQKALSKVKRIEKEYEDLLNQYNDLKSASPINVR